MSTAGVDHLEAIQSDLACPGCQYNLRGLRGQIVTCPECGSTVDAARMIADQWKIPWQQAPGFSVIALPVLPAAIAALLALGLAMFVPNAALDRVVIGSAVIIGLIALLLTIWLALCWRVHAKLDGTWGLRLCALAHLVVAGYCVCFWGSFILVGIAAFGNMMLPLRVVPLLLAGGCVAGLFALYRADRAIGTMLIGRYLRSQAMEPVDHSQ